MKIKTRKITCIILLILVVGLAHAQVKPIIEATETSITVDGENPGKIISRHIYGHFSEHLGRCIYGGIWVGEDSPIPNVNGIRSDIVQALRRINIPNLRWPGGCFADEYHWQDGVGPADQRPPMLNTHWGGVTEDNTFGTHEFLELCRQLDCEPYICGNVGSGTVRELQQWVEYATFDGISPMANLRKQNGRQEPWKVKYWGVGNENWGCGGRMIPMYYANLYKRFSTYVKTYSDNPVYRIACGPNNTNYDWTEVLMREAGRHMDGLSMHFYTVTKTWQRKGSATDFTEKDWFETVKKAGFMDELIQKHTEIMDKYDKRKRVGLIVDEWGTWYDVEPETNPRFLYQQNTLRDAMVAALTLNIFHKHCDRVHMANIAQTVNVLQAMILTKEDKMLLTPTYHVYDMYKVHQDSTSLPLQITGSKYEFEKQSIPTITATASRAKQDEVHISIVNLDPNRPANVSCVLKGIDHKTISGTVLTADKINAHNTFEKPNTIKPEAFKDFRFKNGTLSINLPAKSIVALELL